MMNLSRVDFLENHERLQRLLALGWFCFSNGGGVTAADPRDSGSRIASRFRQE